MKNNTQQKVDVYRNFPKTYIDQAIEEASRVTSKGRDGRLFFKELRSKLKKMHSNLKA